MVPSTGYPRTVPFSLCRQYMYVVGKDSPKKGIRLYVCMFEFGISAFLLIYTALM